eukprot:15477493-Alexandrium_andersonii.AAC.1
MDNSNDATTTLKAAANGFERFRAPSCDTLRQNHRPPQIRPNKRLKQVPEALAFGLAARGPGEGANRA